VEVPILGRLPFHPKRKRLLLWGRRGRQRRRYTAVPAVGGGTTAVGVFLSTVHVGDEIINSEGMEQVEEDE